MDIPQIDSITATQASDHLPLMNIAASQHPPEFHAQAPVAQRNALPDIENSFHPLMRTLMQMTRSQGVFTDTWRQVHQIGQYWEMV